MATHHHELSKEESERTSLALRATLERYSGLPALDRWRLYERLCAALGCIPLSEHPPPTPEVPAGFVLWRSDLQSAWIDWARLHYGMPDFTVRRDLTIHWILGRD